MAFIFQTISSSRSFAFLHVTREHLSPPPPPLPTLAFVMCPSVTAADVSRRLSVFATAAPAAAAAVHRCHESNHEFNHESLKSVVKNVPPPQGPTGGPLRALIYDSVYDEYKVRDFT